MSFPKLDRKKIKMKSLSERISKVDIEKSFISPFQSAKEFPELEHAIIAEVTEKVVEAKKNSKPVMLSFGAHTIKNGLAPVLIYLMEEGYLTHLATNGAGIIHDWEFAFQGKSSEDVQANVDRGEFGNWQETGFYINLALNVGAYEGKGYGASVGAMIQNDGLTIPTEEQLKKEIENNIELDPSRVASSADLLSIIKDFDLASGWMEIPHPWKKFSVQAAAFRLGIPLTGHPMIGHDIIYNHPINHGASIGRVAMRDFLTFAESVSRIDGGVYLSIGSAVMSPMIFEKSLSMSQNIAIQNGDHIENHFILVVDLAKSHWDWRKGEPPMDNPDYYLRFNKSFNRMGGTMRYLTADNRDFLLTFSQNLANTI